MQKRLVIRRLDPNHGIHAGNAACANQRLHSGGVNPDVLVANPDAVEAEHADQLKKSRVLIKQFHHENRFAGA